MSSMEEIFQKACNEQEIPGVVLVAGDSIGKFHYQKAIGPKSPTDPITLDSTFEIASCTKLMTSIAGLQCVERGEVRLDEDLEHVLTEFKNVKILTGFEEGTGEAILTKPENKITLRHLLTHTAGFSYGYKYVQYRSSRHETEAIKSMSQIEKLSSCPLLFEPGTGWDYGYNIDWVGILISRLTGLSLEEYMSKYIWLPLGIKNITFHPSKHPEIEKHLVKMSARAGIPNPMQGVPVRNDEKIVWLEKRFLGPENVEEFGGEGCVANALDFFKVLQSICSNDGKLLKSAIIDEMFTPQLSGTALEKFLGTELPFNNGAFGVPNQGTKGNHGLAGMLLEEDGETGRGKRTMCWAGLPNCVWNVDRERGLCWFYATQLCPCGDFKTGDMLGLFEKEMYVRLAETHGM